MSVPQATPAAQPRAVFTLDQPPDGQIRLIVTADRGTVVIRRFRRSDQAPAPDGFAAEGLGLVIRASDVAELRALLELASVELQP